MRKLAIAAFSFATAIFLSQYLLPEAWVLWAAAAMLALGFCGFFLKGRRRTALMLVSFALAVGFIWNTAYTRLFFAPAAAFDGKTDLTVSARAENFPEKDGDATELHITVFDESGRKFKTLLYLYDDSADGVSPGDMLVLTADFSLADRTHGSKTTYYTSNGYFLVATGVSSFNVSEKADFSLKYAHRYAAKAITDKITEIFPEETAGFMQALLTGNRIAINGDEELTGAMKRTGVYHIIAVSGLHVSVLVAFIMFMLGHYNWTVFVIAPVLLIFMGISGFSPSVVRAVVMQLTVLAAHIANEQDDPLTSLSFALLLILAVNPFSAASAALQFSFAAMLGIILFSGRIYGFFYRHFDKSTRKKRLPRTAFKLIFGGLATSLGAMAFTVPLTAVYFGYFSPIAPIMNILILWAVSAAFCAGLVAVGFGFISVPIGTVCAAAASYPVMYIISLVKAESRSFLSAIYLNSLPLIIWFVCVYAAILVFIIVKPRVRAMLVPACAAIVSLCAILVFTSETAKTDDAFSAAVLDVGQGQCIVLRSGEYTAVVDCGSSGGAKAGEVVYGYLAGEGISSVDILILTHYHADHANGADELMNTMNVSNLAVPRPLYEESTLDEKIISVANSTDTAIIYVDSDMTVQLGDMTLTLFAPVDSEWENERCVCILAGAGEYEMLITGDMDASSERRFLRHAELPDIEILVVGHHGSKYSTCDELLDTVKAEIAVISVGENSYGHPTPETLERLYKRGMDVYRTDTYGHVILTPGE